MEKNNETQDLSVKLNLVASLLLDVKEELGEKMSVREKVRYLLKRGVFRDEDISTVVGITRSHASKEKAMIKKEDKKGNG